MAGYVIGLHEVDRTQVSLVGGKGAHLGELLRLGVRVPAGFCVTTEAFDRLLADAPSLRVKLDALAKAHDRETIRVLSGEIRQIIEHIETPSEVRDAITVSLGDGAFAVRSSATAEDLPTASFAGQQDSYLNVVGADAIIERVRRCQASLFTERAVTYRARNGFDHRKVRMAVVVQQMVVPQSSGVMFTADPISGHRRISSIEATAGLGEAHVSGLVNADVYTVRDAAIVSRQTGREPTLTDEQVLVLSKLGRKIEAHFGQPQDIEWCLVDGDFAFVQSRPITTLFPIPERTDAENRVYLSVGHQQMMTDAMKPLGLSMFQLTAMRPMFEAGSRLFVDVTNELASPTKRAGLFAMAGKSDPLIRDALETVLERGDFIRTIEDEAAPAMSSPPPAIETDAAIVTGLIERNEASVEALKQALQTKSGVEVFDFIREDVETGLKRFLFDPQSNRALMAGIEATWWLNDRLQQWLGEKNAADVLTQSVPHNVTSEMGLSLLDVADVIRPHPELVASLQQIEGDDFLDQLPQPARDALQGWLDKYGMRCAGEIDLTRPRWHERPSTLLPVLLGHLRDFEQGAGKQRFEQGKQEAARKEREVLERLRALPDGEQKAEETRRMIDRVRTFIGYREYPKYGIVRRYDAYKRALLAEADRLVEAGVLSERDDAFFLTFDELREAVRTQTSDAGLIRRRQEAFRSHQTLTPPRVLTSDGEAIAGSYRRDDLPPGALAGLAVSAGTVEGRARVILDMAEANLEPGDILVTRFTDPSWTPLFVGLKGLVTEVGGLMTHGAVIAREYGLPAVVGVEQATRRIRDGQRIRVEGTAGYVEVLD